MRRHFRKLWNDERGNSLILAAAAMPLLIGSAGLATDTIQWALWKRELQRAADSAAVAGVMAKVQGASYSAAVTTDLARNNDVNGITISTSATSAPSAGAYTSDTNAVRVSLQAKQQLSFSSMFMTSAPTITATATATIVPAGDYCVVSLINTDDTGLSMGGNAHVDLGCGMITNSTSMDAAISYGSATVDASPIAAVGGIDASGNWEDDVQLLPFTMAQADPFKNVNPPAPTGCQDFKDYFGAGEENKVGGTVDLSQEHTYPNGVYCIDDGGTLDIKGNVTLGKGTYVLNATSLKMASNGGGAGSQPALKCDGCTIVLTSTSTANPDSTIGTVDLTGGTLDLTSPTSGTYKGISIYQDRRADPTAGTNKINGNSGSDLEGAFYFPKQQLQFTGTAGVTFTCVQMVAYTVTFSGNSKVTNNCPTGGGGSSFKGQAVRLVE